MRSVAIRGSACTPDHPRRTHEPTSRRSARSACAPHHRERPASSTLLLHAVCHCRACLQFSQVPQVPLVVVARSRRNLSENRICQPVLASTVWSVHTRMNGRYLQFARHRMGPQDAKIGDRLRTVLCPSDLHVRENPRQSRNPTEVTKSSFSTSVRLECFTMIKTSLAEELISGAPPAPGSRVFGFE